jgi:hypothetical protein
MADTAALTESARIQNPALDAGSRPASAGQTYEPPVQHLAAHILLTGFAPLINEQLPIRCYDELTDLL